MSVILDTFSLRLMTTDATTRYLQALLEGDESNARLVLDQYIEATGSSLRAALEVLTAAQRELGELWHNGEISVAIEHRGTAISKNQLARLRSLFPRKPLRYQHRILATVLEGEQHWLAPQLLSDIFWSEGYDVRSILDSLSISDLCELIRLERPHILLLSLTNSSTKPHLLKLLKVLAQEALNVPVIAGGLALLGAQIF
jgi:MerR family transcriptional regulator, light-induced transcriptional regulator